MRPDWFLPLTTLVNIISKGKSSTDHLYHFTTAMAIKKQQQQQQQRKKVPEM